MNKVKYLILGISAAVLFTACGSSSNPSSSEEELSSSSEYDASSSSKINDKLSSSSAKDEKSSSSVAKTESSSSNENTSKSSSSSAKAPESSSSADDSKAYRAATLNELEKNLELQLFDQTVYLSTGSKQGMIALRIPDELWAVTYTDFADGVVFFTEENTGMQYANTDAAKKIIDGIEKGLKISFVIDTNDVVKYSVNDSKEYNNAIKASVAIQANKISKAENLKDRIYECTDGDTTRILTFFDNTYIIDNYVDETLVDWFAGHYDIQRSTLLMLPVYSNLSSYQSLYTYSAGTDYITIGEKKLSCEVDAVSYEYEDASDFVGKWFATKDGIEWNFELRSDGKYELVALDGDEAIEMKSGVWEIYGYHLMMRNTSCLDSKTCTPSIHGQVQTGTLDPETGKISGFSYLHKDPDTPKIPTSFESQIFE